MQAFLWVDPEGFAWVHDLYWATEPGKDHPILIVQQWIWDDPKSAFWWSAYAAPWYGILTAGFIVPGARGWPRCDKEVTVEDMRQVARVIAAGESAANRLIGLAQFEPIHSHPRCEDGALLGGGR